MRYSRSSKRPPHIFANPRISYESTDSLLGVLPDKRSIFFRGSVDVGQSVGRHSYHDGRFRLLIFHVAMLDIRAVRLKSPHLERYGVTEKRGDAHADGDDPFVGPVAGWDVLDANAHPSLCESQAARAEQDDLVEVPSEARDPVDDLLSLEHQNFPAAQADLRFGLARIGYALF